ncbi:MAG: hypothetical protein V7K35_04590 [Nostoc sp.]
MIQGFYFDLILALGFALAVGIAYVLVFYHPKIFNISFFAKVKRPLAKIPNTPP